MGKEWPRKEIERLKLAWQFILSFFFPERGREGFDGCVVVKQRRLNDTAKNKIAVILTGPVHVSTT